MVGHHRDSCCTWPLKHGLKVHSEQERWDRQVVKLASPRNRNYSLEAITKTHSLSEYINCTPHPSFPAVLGRFLQTRKEEEREKNISKQKVASWKKSRCLPRGRCSWSICWHCRWWRWCAWVKAAPQYTSSFTNQYFPAASRQDMIKALDINRVKHQIPFGLHDLPSCHVSYYLNRK